MHNAALTAVGLHGWRYQLLPVPPQLFDETVPSLRQAGFRGVNVTIPHKAAALALATDRTERAAAIGAANTLTFEPGGEIAADNTDAPALIAALPFAARGPDRRRARRGGQRPSRRLGAGRRGGSRGADLEPLAAAGAGAGERARSDRAGKQPTSARRRHPGQLHLGRSRRRRSVRAALPVDESSLSDYRCVVDLVYTPTGTRLIEAAAAAGAATVDGLQILVGQGALSFERFTGLPAPLDVMQAAARGS